jgi:hypothetical protein
MSFEGMQEAAGERPRPHHTPTPACPSVSRMTHSNAKPIALPRQSRRMLPGSIGHFPTWASPPRCGARASAVAPASARSARKMICDENATASSDLAWHRR